jgi:hypothetical protein
VGIEGAELPDRFEQTINLGLVWHEPWLKDCIYEWFNFFHDDGDLAILDK